MEREIERGSNIRERNVEREIKRDGEGRRAIEKDTEI